MAKTRKAGKKGGVKLSAREKATRVKQKNLKKLQTVINRIEKKVQTADKKVIKAQEKLDKELRNMEDLNLQFNKALSDYDSAANTKTFDSLNNI
tara:strand:- start:445 stop:726 length:282 start_codon:yes stop_codon:yes gene_type:complete